MEELCRWPEDFDDVVHETIETIEHGMDCNPIELEHTRIVLKDVMKHYHGTINPKKAEEKIKELILNYEEYLEST